MASVTYYVVLPFVWDEETGELVAVEGQEAPSEHAAMSRARAMVSRKAGAVAFRRTGNPSLGDFDDAVILGSYGDVSADVIGFRPPEQ